MPEWAAPDLSRSRAVLLGCAEYSYLTAVPAATHSLNRMHRLLTNPELCGWPTSQVTKLDRERLPGDLPDRLVEFYSDIRDVALFYYVGHGQVADPNDRLCLALADTLDRPERRATTSLTFDAVRDALVSSPAKVKIVILDCCFAGLALGGPGTLGEADMMAMTGGTSAFTLAACGGFSTAWFETDPAISAPQTYFTRALVDIVESGIEDSGPMLTLNAIAHRLKEYLPGAGRPRPEFRSRDFGDTFPFARNLRVLSRDQPGMGTELPRYLMHALENGNSDLRIGAIHEIAELLKEPMLEPAAERAPWDAADNDIGNVADAARAVLERVPSFAQGALAQSSTSPRRRPANELNSADNWPWIPQGVAATMTGPLALALALSPDGTLLASGGHATAVGGVGVWHTATAKQVQTLLGHSETVNTVAFSPDGTVLASGSEDNTVRLWSLAAGACVRTLGGHTDAVRAVAFSPAEGLLASGSNDTTVQVWETATGACLRTLEGHTDWVTGVAFGPDGVLLATSSADRTIRLWRAATGEQALTLKGHSGRINSVAFSPSGKLLVSGSEDLTVRVWEPRTGVCLRILEGHTGVVWGVAFSPSGKLVASGGEDKTVRVWNPANGASRILVGHSRGVNAVAFSPAEDLLVSIGDDNTVLWR